MENTSRIFFEDDRSQWYLSEGTGWVGPFSATQIHQRIEAGALTLAHYIWKVGQSEWKRICDVKAFQVLVPGAPKATKPTVKAAKGRTPPPPPAAEGPALNAAWYVYAQNAEHGPFSYAEIARLLEVSKISASTFLWTEGMSQWEPLEKIAAFASGKRPRKFDQAQGSAKSEKRGTPRRPFVAQIRLTNDQDLITGVCRDISIGGMQVLTDQIPGQVGAVIKLNITPPAGQKIPAFVTEGVIVRILEDGRGFSFRFAQLPDAARKLIQEYVANEGSV